jgi:hypothetical protein
MSLPQSEVRAFAAWGILYISCTPDGVPDVGARSQWHMAADVPDVLPRRSVTRNCRLHANAAASYHILGAPRYPAQASILREQFVACIRAIASRTRGAADVLERVEACEGGSYDRGEEVLTFTMMRLSNSPPKTLKSPEKRYQPPTKQILISQARASS